MSNTYPPPPQPDQQHYNALYPTNAGAAQSVEPAQPEELQYSNLDQSLYSKAQSTTPTDGKPEHHIDSLTRNLQQHAALDEQQRQYSAQHLHHDPQGSTSGDIAATLGLSEQQAIAEQAQKSNRLRKACDACSIRKVKCDASGPPCRACAALDIPCTFSRPSRRRGPPNRHAEAIKRQKLGDVTEHSSRLSGNGTTSPSPPTHAAEALASLSSQASGHSLSAESICPIAMLDLLIDDFFTYIHPLCPFPHEPSFREAWKRREDLSNKPFLALLSSMIAALVASFPKKLRLHIPAQAKESMFPNHTSLVNRCQLICAAARGIGYLDKDELNVYDAATSYFLALVGVYTFRWRQSRLYFGECMTIIRTLGLHKPEEPSYTQLGRLPAALGSNGPTFDGSRGPVDNITQEMGRRIFWTMFVSVKTIHQLGASFAELVIPPPTAAEPYPPLPAEVDDFCIFPTHSEPQPSGLLSKTAGFNANVVVYSSYTALATMEMAWGADAVVDRERQEQMLLDALQRCKKAVIDLPSELTGTSTADSFGAQQNGNAPRVNSFSPPVGSRHPAETLAGASHGTEMESPEETRRMQYEIQKANIYVSYLATRMFLVEKYFDLCDAHYRARSSSLDTGSTGDTIDAMPPPTDPASGYEQVNEPMRQERENVVKDLLAVLSKVSSVNYEPSADSFITRMRVIASTLLDASDQRKGQLAVQAQEPLSTFLKLLIELESEGPADEESALRQWGGLRDAQMKFAELAGLPSIS